ncbi:MAG: hypothetical protein HY043_14950 [Verrucomicrobia bacterium]|nr:hypothetical protein [Verrucomicrobiota bacterium]
MEHYHGNRRQAQNNADGKPVSRSFWIHPIGETRLPTQKRGANVVICVRPVNLRFERLRPAGHVREHDGGELALLGAAAHVSSPEGDRK